MSAVTTELVQKTLYVRGEGEATGTILKEKGDFSSYTSIIFEDGPSSVNAGFISMSSLQTIEFSKTVVDIIGENFFKNYKLTKFIVSTENPKLWTDGTFLYKNNNLTLVGCIYQPSHMNLLPSITHLQTSSLSSVVYRNTLILPKSIQTISKRICVESKITTLQFEEDSVLTEIPANAFEYSQISEIHIPPSVSTIAQYSFYYCYCPTIIFDHLSESSLTTLGNSSFESSTCTGLSLPPKITGIPINCFASSNIASINIPRDCRTVDVTAFGGCALLMTITVDDGNTAFKDLNGVIFTSDDKQIIFASPLVESFTIPANLEEIGLSVIQSLVNVDTINIDPGNQVFKTSNGVLYNKDFTNLIGVCGGVKEVEVAATTKKVLEKACYGVKITSVKFLGEVCTELGTFAFGQCTSLHSFKIPRGLQNIGADCFRYSGLNELTYDSDSSLNEILPRAFYGLSMKIVKLPKSLTRFHYAAFANVNGVEEFDLEQPSQLAEIAANVFVGFKCTKTNKIVIPASTKTISTTAFSGCDLEITFAENCIIDTLTEYIFQNTNGIKDTFKIPANVVTISVSAFEGCKNLNRIEFEANSKITTIKGAAFKGCTNLESISLPANLESVDYSFISSCFALTDITIDSNNQHLKAENNIIYNKLQSELIVCSPGIAEALVSALVQTILSNAFFECSILENVKFYSPSGLGTISQNTFAGCIKLETITLPENLHTIGDNSFQNCISLSTVRFDDRSKIKTIGAGAFSGCVKLSQVSFNGNELQTLGDNVFENCYMLSKISVPNSVTYYGQRCFASSGILSIEIGSPNTIGIESFQNCTGLISVSIESAQTIPARMFEGCLSLNQIDFPANIASLGDESFARTAFVNIALPPSVTSIGNRCFSGCTQLKYLNVSNTATFGDNSLSGCNNLIYVAYCGSGPVANNCGISTTAHVYVNQQYSGESFCASPFLRQLNNQCAFIPPTATPSMLFTASQSQASLMIISLIATINGDGLSEE